MRTGADAVDVPVPPIVVQLRQRPGPDMAGQPVLYCPTPFVHSHNCLVARLFHLPHRQTMFGDRYGNALAKWT